MSLKDYVVKEGFRVKHNAKTYGSGEELQLTEDQAKGLHVETKDQAKARAVLAGKASFGPSEADTPTPNSKALVAKINAAKGTEAVKTLMSLSETKTVKTAGTKRLEQIAKEKKDTPPTKYELLAKIAEASTVDELTDLLSLSEKSLSPDVFEEVSEAIEARNKELEG